MLIRVVIDPEDDGDRENYHISVVADANMTIEGIKLILQIAQDTVNNTIPSLSLGNIKHILDPIDLKKVN